MNQAIIKLEADRMSLSMGYAKIRRDYNNMKEKHPHYMDRGVQGKLARIKWKINKLDKQLENTRRKEC
jgi:hypothetical protein